MNLIQQFVDGLCIEGKQRREKAWQKFKREHPHLVKVQTPGFEGITEVQDNFHMPDETVPVSSVWPPCPSCRRRHFLWRLVQRDGRRLFQVRPGLGEKYCQAGVFPHEPIPDSKGAVRAWTVYVRLTQTE